LLGHLVLFPLPSSLGFVLVLGLVGSDEHHHLPTVFGGPLTV
jgi:hypothetical protein